MYRQMGHVSAAILRSRERELALGSGKGRDVLGGVGVRGSKKRCLSVLTPHLHMSVTTVLGHVASSSRGRTETNQAAMAARIFIVAGKRTPFGAFGGALKGKSATELCVHATKAALAAGKVNPAIIDTVVVGSVQQTSPDAAYLARHVALKAEMKEPTPALTINRLCGSGFQSCVNVAQEIRLGEAAVGVAAGTESMSQAPMAVYGHEVRWGTRLGSPTEMKDTLWAGLTDSHAGCPMGVTAENLASDFSISRVESDTYALESQARWVKAKEAGTFDDEIAPIELKSRKGPVSFDTDEHPRATTLEKMGKLPTTFKKDGVVRATTHTHARPPWPAQAQCSDRELSACLALCR